MNNLKRLFDDPPERPRLLRYGCAVLSIGVATSLQILMETLLGHQTSIAILLLAILVTAGYGGVWPALGATILGFLSADYLVSLPYGSFKLQSGDQYVRLMLYALTGTGIAVLGGVMQAAPMSANRKLLAVAEKLIHSCPNRTEKDLIKRSNSSACRRISRLPDPAA